MSEHPILFSGEMVRAILENRKTQTRRVIKPQAPDEYPIAVCDAHGLCLWSDDGTEEGDWYPDNPIRCPYGKAGDRLWVRETLRSVRDCEACSPLAVYDVDRAPVKSGDKLVRWQWENSVLPGLFMPRWASRITLEVTNVRVERVQDISEADAIAEGCRVKEWEDPFRPESARTDFKNLWDSINAKRGYGWDVNPWVFVIEFKKVSA